MTKTMNKTEPTTAEIQERHDENNSNRYRYYLDCGILLKQLAATSNELAAARSEQEIGYEEQRQLTERLADAEEKIDSAVMAACETQRSWETRCYAIMVGLGEDFGTPVNQAEATIKAIGEYLTTCGVLRQEPDKHAIEALLREHF